MMTKEKSQSKVDGRKSSAKLLIIGAIFALLTFFGYRFFSFRKQMNERRQAMQEQRQVMIDHWKEQGLTDEEIEEKLRDFRPERMNHSQRPPGMGVMRFFFRGRREGR
jgi:predicted negative regulator of RcsB-dependent stress response